MRVVYEFYEASRVWFNNTGDTLQVPLSTQWQRGDRALISLSVNMEGALQNGISAFYYKVAIRESDLSASDATNAVIPLASGWLRRGPWTPGSNATTTVNDESGFRWEGFEPFDPKNPLTGVEVYGITLNGGTPTIRIRAVVRVELP